ncbi:MAG: ComF family protein [Anaerolineae bacterium]|nr:ComF family protein [Anaerolineae bacterium]
MAQPLGHVLATWWKDHPQPPTDVIVPVPLHPERLHQRGYNQTALLAHHMSRATGIPVAEHMLIRTRNTGSQMRLAAEARRQNVAEAFLCPDGYARGKHVLVLDDVCTTGATLEACADALHAADAATVHALTLARTP